MGFMEKWNFKVNELFESQPTPVELFEGIDDVFSPEKFQTQFWQSYLDLVAAINAIVTTATRKTGGTVEGDPWGHVLHTRKEDRNFEEIHWELKYELNCVVIDVPHDLANRDAFTDYIEVLLKKLKSALGTPENWTEVESLVYKYMGNFNFDWAIYVEDTSLFETELVGIEPGAATHRAILEAENQDQTLPTMMTGTAALALTFQLTELREDPFYLSEVVVF